MSIDPATGREVLQRSEDVSPNACSRRRRCVVVCRFIDHPVVAVPSARCARAHQRRATVRAERSSGLVTTTRTEIMRSNGPHAAQVAARSDAPHAGWLSWPFRVRSFHRPVGATFNVIEMSSSECPSTRNRSGVVPMTWKPCCVYSAWAPALSENTPRSIQTMLGWTRAHPIAVANSNEPPPRRRCERAMPSPN